MENIDYTNKFIQATRAIVTNIFVNNYAMERVVFGYEKIGETAPVDLYLDHLHLNINDGPHRRSVIPGIYIDEQEHISTEYDYAEYVRDLFAYRMECIFDHAPKDVRLEHELEELPLLPRFREYLFGLLPLFAEILNVEIKYDAFDVIVTDKADREREYGKWKKFVTAILLKPLRAGSQINKYVKDFITAPYYVRRLIEKRGNNFYLKPIDFSSYEYAFALFSLMQFMNGEHGKILELKMREWERLHKSEY